MPPRRSCFGPSLVVGMTAFAGFNATTAFLLGFEPELVGSIPTVSMPPRRSCFMKSKERRILIQMFQCHHGVPA